MSKNCQAWGGGGNTGTEPYITSHNVLLAHAKAARTYKDKYQK
jgi:beta-glucosidase